MEVNGTSMNTELPIGLAIFGLIAVVMVLLVRKRGPELLPTRGLIAENTG